MVYKDYKWTAAADYDNPKVISGNDHSELNRTEGYEMLYFIRSLAKSWDWKDEAIRACQKIERTIRMYVPATIRTHSAIKQWIETNYTSFWDLV